MTFGAEPSSPPDPLSGGRWLPLGLRAVVTRTRLLVAAVLLSGAVGVRGAAWIVPLPDGFFTSGSKVVSYGDGSFAHVFLSPDDKWRISVRDDEVDPKYLQALLQLEDQRFFSHSGVDFRAAARAAWTNFLRGRVVSGASTLTMQLVRVREPRPRTVFSKLVEAFRAWQLEARYDKRAILGFYLTYVPYGRNLEGIEAASIAYFGHRAKRLSPDEIATLLAVPQNPTQRHPSPKNRHRLRAARDRLAERLAPVLAGERSTEDVVKEVKRAAVVTRMKPFPRRAAHAAYWLASDRFADGARTGRIPTTLDRGTQRIAAAAMREAGARVRDLGIHNGAAVVVDHATAEVRALVGNFDFWSPGHGAQIPGFDRPRSPGSTLKPFLYALALDRGEVLPEHLVADVPHRYGTYAPKNYDGRFDGLVRLEDALARSLNVPFVDMLASLGVEAFIGHLHAWGVDSLVSESGFYGLSAAIGGLEVSPLELAGLYAMLAQGGRYRPVTLSPSDDEPVPMFAEGVAYLTQRALRSRDRPDFPARRRWSGVPPQVHWKTGTSYGHRDAWAAGSDDRHTVVVWLGNFDNRPSRHLVGADAAGPVMFDILEALSAGRPPAELPSPPEDLTRVEVCRFSGHRPSHACPHKVYAWALTQRVPTEVCPYHVAIDVERETGLAMRPGCRKGRHFDRQAFLRLPSSIRRWMSAHRRDLPAPPSWAKGCAAASDAVDPPVITSPAAGQTALMIPGVEAARQEIPLEAESQAQQLSWFVDGKYVGTTSADQPLWWAPVPGRHEVVVVDESGTSSARAFRVAGRVGG